MTTERQSLLQAILDIPEDDTPRLIYADWLEEYGSFQDRLFAEYLRKHLVIPEVETILGPGDSLTYKDTVVATGDRRLNGKGAYHNGKLVLRRGFVDEVRLSCQHFLEHADVLFSKHPIQEVILTDRIPNQRQMFFVLSAHKHWQENEALLPWELWRLAKLDRSNWYFYSKEGALSFLSRLCVSYGRQKVRKPLAAEPTRKV